VTGYCIRFGGEVNGVWLELQCEKKKVSRITASVFGLGNWKEAVVPEDSFLLPSMYYDFQVFLSSVYFLVFFFLSM
jgi:hypothetical protein